jgi:hypothetical protein
MSLLHACIMIAHESAANKLAKMALDLRVPAADAASISFSTEDLEALGQLVAAGQVAL